MAQYIKPGIKIAAIDHPLRPAGSCTTSLEDIKLLEDVFGITDWDKAFAVGDGCQDEYLIDEYCKFTSVNNGIATVVLQS